MISFRGFRLVAAAIALISVSAPSHAIVISSTDNNPYNFTWSFSSAAGLLTGSGSMTLSGFGTGALTLDISLSNTSALSNNRLTGFGFGIDPDAYPNGVEFVDGDDGGMVDAAVPQNNNIGSGIIIDICAWGGNNCQGGSNGGILGGGTDSFSIILAGAWGDSVNIDPVAFKYQTGAGSFHFTTSSSSSGTQVPEPASTLVVLGLGLLGVGFMQRRRRHAT